MPKPVEPIFELSIWSFMWTFSFVDSRNYLRNYSRYISSFNNGLSRCCFCFCAAMVFESLAFGNWKAPFRSDGSKPWLVPTRDWALKVDSSWFLTVVTFTIVGLGSPKARKPLFLLPLVIYELTSLSNSLLPKDWAYLFLSESNWIVWRNRFARSFPNLVSSLCISDACSMDLLRLFLMFGILTNFSLAPLIPLVPV